MNWKERQYLNPHMICAACETTPEEVGYDKSRLDVLNRHLQSMIDRDMIWSGSYCLARNGKVFADSSVGSMAVRWQGREKFEPDTFFELQSVTKMITGVAVLKLAEDGVLYLDQPVAEWVEEFNTGDFRKVTILHLLTHTSGLVALEGANEGEPWDWYQWIDREHVAETWIAAIVRMGLLSAPGKEWRYSMAGFLILGEIIARASGMSAEEFIRQEILLPCDMRQTHWKKYATDEQIRKYNIVSDQDLEDCRRYETMGRRAFVHCAPWQEGLECEEIPETAGGLMTVGRELVRFGQMLLNDGTYGDRRVLGRKACEFMFHDLIREDGVRDFCWNHPGNPVIYGAGASVFSRRADCQQLISEGVLYHEGAGACMLMIDKKEDFVAVYRTQFKRDEWHAEGIRSTASIIWSGL